MEALARLLFEDPTALYWLFGFAQVLALAGLYLRRSGRMAALAMLPAVLALAAFLAARWVTTERERLAAAAAELVEAVVADDETALQRLIAADYDDGRYDKPRLLALIGQTARSFGLNDGRITALRIDIRGDDGQVRLWATADLSAPMVAGRDAVPTVWTLWWTRADGTWRLSSSRLEQPAGWPGAPGGPPRP